MPESSDVQFEYIDIDRFQPITVNNDHTIITYEFNNPDCACDCSERSIRTGGRYGSRFVSNNVLTNIRNEDLDEFRKGLEKLSTWVDPIQKMEMKKKLIKMNKIITRVILYA